ncbi:hypothetical protein [Streptomyces sp. HNM0574]|uniref:hypothetical protein n=1 Tax=Streptomyces sp. HNM0574 TaxID=2714954 RepID=UPI00146DEF62|nr:hypothetical protein [Streptomyces sp. HNM0574]NLU68674.1 hypothetical protein [Streptomyces sp. HNM0574]
MEADTRWMRNAADDCDATANGIRKLLTEADDAVETLNRAAAGFDLLGGQVELSRRFELLNKLLRDELEEAAENIRFCASKHDGNENFVTETWHALTH